ncbi:MAG: DEAD/DEAH box helicase family protein [Acidimicrobiaceae bacterium]|nr:DEAD/DEAH box helicase family protein [Acidimicrobiaceae bacterium]
MAEAYADDEGAEFDPAVDPILCSPYSEPSLHWDLDRAGRARAGVAPLPGRRLSMLLRPVPDDDAAGALSLDFDTVESNRLINDIRDRVRAWRADGYAGATTVTRKLLWHWAEEAPQRQLRPFFAQREAIETVIWLREVARRDTPERRDLEAASRQFNDGIVRYCAKMATGTGKTAVMGMLIAWQTLNAVRSGRRRNLQHSSRFLVLTPGLTVRDRLAALRPSEPGNVYAELGLVPSEFASDLSAARIEIVNYQAFRPQDPSGATGAQKSLLGTARVDQTESRAAMLRRVLGGLLARRGAHGDIVVINDEAHHCYLPAQPETAGADGDSDGKKAPKPTQDEKDANKIASVWFNAIRGLRDIGALGTLDPSGGQASPVFDFSATPMWIGRANRGQAAMFEWVASDFGLMDAIESGLVKVPRVPVEDDTAEGETAWRRIYAKTQRKTLPKRSEDPTATLPEPLAGALNAAAAEWQRAFDAQERRSPPPALIVVANKVSSAVALYEHIAGCETADGLLVPGVYPQFSNVIDGADGRPAAWSTKPVTLLVHSRLDDEDEMSTGWKKLLSEQARHMGADVPPDAIREALNTVGKRGRLGEHVRCVVSVSMLTEGWDARNVRQIVGYRAFSTQLLCEQVTGRALRRTSCDSFRDPEAEPDKKDLLTPEYAEVLGIPFEFMPVRGTRAGPPPRDPTWVRTVEGREALRIEWPQVVEYRTLAQQVRFRLNPDRVQPVALSEGAAVEMALMAGVSGEEFVLSADDWRREKSALVRCAAEMANLLTTDSRLQPDIGGSSHTKGDETASSGDESDAVGTDSVRGAGRCSLFTSAYAALRDWMAHPDVSGARPSVLLRHCDKRDLYQQIIAACDFTDDARDGAIAPTPPPRQIAVLASPPLADTSAVEFATTLSDITEAKRSELSHAACHSKLELRTAQRLDAHPVVETWARNFGLGWTLPYHFDGAWRSYEPDFIVRLSDGLNLVIECKGIVDDKAQAAERWVREHWIPAVADTAALPPELRRWAYEVITDDAHLPARLNALVGQSDTVLAAALDAEE